MSLKEKYLRSEQQLRYIAPHAFVEDDIEAVYARDEIEIGWPLGAERIYNDISRDATVAVIGVQLGDEGKGRLVDNKLVGILQIPGVQAAYVIRYGGGSGTGHTVYSDKGEKVPLHQLPSGIMHPEAVGVMDTGMVIHMEDLQTEIVDAEKIVGDLRGKLILSDDAILVSDLDRAMEVLNRDWSEGRSSGGTGRGMTQGYGDFITRNEMHVKELFEEDWEVKFRARYAKYEKRFRDSDKDLSQMDVPDLRETRKQNIGRGITRKVGTVDEYIDRLKSVREWFSHRDETVSEEKRLRQNTFLIHQDLLTDMSRGVLFEGAQAVGLSAWLGRRPDSASSDTTANAIESGTQVWKTNQIEDRVGTFKITYMSSVGAAHMITQYDIPRETVTEEQIAAMNDDQKLALWIRTEAHETGTTSGRYRDMCRLDLEMMRYNIRMGGIEVLAGTHLDIAREGVDIEVCTHYTNAAGERVPYQPGLEHQAGLTPQYIKLPGWDGKKVSQAKSFDEIPDNAKRFLAFIQRQTGVPIVFVTTGPQRENAVDMPEVKLSRVQLERPRREAKIINKIVDKKGNIYNSTNGKKAA